MRPWTTSPSPAPCTSSRWSRDRWRGHGDHGAVHALPAFHGFLAAKLAGLVVYILLGMTAFRWGRTQGQRMAAWFAAQALFLYIVGVALTKSPTLLPAPG